MSENVDLFYSYVKTSMSEKEKYLLFFNVSSMGKGAKREYSGRTTTAGGRYVGRVHFDLSSTLARL